MIKFTSEGALVNTRRLNDYEKTFSTPWPDDYKKFLLKSNVVTPENNKISTEKGLASASKILGFSTNPIDDLQHVNDLYDGRIPNDFLVIAHAGGGNLFCINLANESIYFWDHELEASENETPSFNNLSLAAASFTEFLEKLTPLNNSDIPTDASVISVTVKPGFAQKFGAYIKK